MRNTRLKLMLARPLYLLLYMNFQGTILIFKTFMLVYVNNNSHWIIAIIVISLKTFSSVGIYYINNDIFIKQNRCKLFIRRGKAICLCVEMYAITFR